MAPIFKQKTSYKKFLDTTLDNETDSETIKTADSENIIGWDESHFLRWPKVVVCLNCEAKAQRDARPILKNEEWNGFEYPECRCCKNVLRDLILI